MSARDLKFTAALPGPLPVVLPSMSLVPLSFVRIFHVDDYLEQGIVTLQ